MQLLFILFIFVSSTFFGDVVLITGASRGIGWETAKTLAHNGHTVYASMRSPKQIEEEQNPLLHLIQLDSTDDASITAALEIVLKKEGRLDVLINNAACAVFGPIELITVEQAKKVFEVNFFGTMRMIQAALPIMKEQNKGLIINMSSTSGIRPSPGWDVYGASKFAIEGLSEAVACVAKHWNIDIVVVEPGTCATNFMKESTEIGQRKASGYEDFLPNALKWMEDRLKQGQSPEEVALVIAQIIADTKRNMRYQTSSKGTETVAKRFIDPTGNLSVEEQTALTKELWLGPLDIHKGGSFSPK